MEWKFDKKALISLLGRTIYRPENVLVEICANSYDADASIVTVATSGESEQIIVKDDGCGMDKKDFEDMVSLAESKKQRMIEKGELTPKYNRHLLGSFGIGIVSFFSLGDSIKFFTRKQGEKPLYLEITKIFGDGNKCLNNLKEKF